MLFRSAPYGFHVIAPGLVAAALEGEVPYVKEGDAIWRFSDFVDVAQFPWTTIRTYW